MSRRRQSRVSREERLSLLKTRAAELTGERDALPLAADGDVDEDDDFVALGAATSQTPSTQRKRARHSLDGVTLPLAHSAAAHDAVPSANLVLSSCFDVCGGSCVHVFHVCAARAC